MLDEIKQQQKAIAEAIREEETLSVSTTHNPELERSVLSCCLRNRDAFDSARLLLIADDFHTSAHKAIWSAMLALHERGVACNTVTLISELDARQQLKAAGGKEFLNALPDDDSLPEHIDSYCHQLRNFTVAREQRRLANKLSALSRTPMSGEDRVAKTKELIEGLAAIVHTGETLETLSGILGRVGKDKFINPLLGESYIETPWDAFNKLLIGFRRGTLNIIGARPSMGKSAMAGCIALYAASKGSPVLFFSLEMRASSVFLRFCCNAAKVSGFKVMHGHATQEETDRLSAAADEIAKLPIYISDKPGATTGDIDLAIKRLASYEGVMPHLLIVDHIQLMRTHKFHKDMRSSMTEISHGLLQIAMEKNIPVLALSQLRRPDKKSQGEMPTMDSLMETGYLEADAFTATIIHRPDFFKSNGDRAKTLVFLQKHRDGPTGKFVLRAEDAYYNFVEVTKEPDDEDED